MTGSVRTFERGIALIVEGATEKMFYQVYLERCCDACPPAHMDKELLDGDVCFVIRGCSHGERLEDVLMCDYAGVLAWLLLAPDTPVPSGRNGKNKLRRLFQLSGRRGAYHAGERSRGFVESLDMAQIEAQVPFDLGELRRRVFEPVIFDL